MPRVPAILLTLALSAVTALAQSPRDALPPDFQSELAGVSLQRYPYFTNVSAFNEGSPVWVAPDTLHEPRFVQRTVDVYVMLHRRPETWQQDRVLRDVRGAPSRLTLVAGGPKQNRHVIDPGTLNGQTGTTEVGVGYDMVLDANLNGMLDADDMLDGWGDEAGFYVMPDLTQDGPYQWVETNYNAGGFIVQDIFYPENVASLGQLPLIVVSHGNGHDYRWYDHIGKFMASWGYIVMSHRNNTGPGIETASNTTLRNTNRFLLDLDVIADGALLGHVDSHNIVFIGHSRGGEGVVRAYRRVVDGDPIATQFSADDIKLVSSIAPVNFLSPAASDPGEVTYSLWTGGADNDVNGCAGCNECQTYHLHERARGERMSITLHGVGHGDFHNGGGSSVASGPCQVGRPNTHQIMRGYLLPMVEHVIHGNIPCKDYLWRQWEALQPIGAPQNPCVVVDLMFQENPNTGKLVLDDFQTNQQRSLSSSGGMVDFSDPLLFEGRLDDSNGSFTDSAADVTNGMTLAGNNEFSSGIVFQWDRTDEFVVFEVPSGLRDLSSFEYLSFRAAQSTRHPLTDAERGDLDFSVQLADTAGHLSTIDIGAYGGGIEEPYQRGSCGVGRGWANEFETIRIPLRDFRSMGKRVRLDDVVAVSFLFGPHNGSSEGRIGLDEIEFTHR